MGVFTNDGVALAADQMFIGSYLRARGYVCEHSWEHGDGDCGVVLESNTILNDYG